jgi:hypothetical protein
VKLQLLRDPAVELAVANFKGDVFDFVSLQDHPSSDFGLDPIADQVAIARWGDEASRTARRRSRLPMIFGRRDWPPSPRHRGDAKSEWSGQRSHYAGG